MGMSTMFVTKQKADKGECRNSVYKLPLWALSEKRNLWYLKSKITIFIKKKSTFFAFLQLKWLVYVQWMKINSVFSWFETSESWWNILWRHEDNEGLVEVVRHWGEGRAVVRVDDEEAGPTRERVQVTGVEADMERKWGWDDDKKTMVIW